MMKKFELPECNLERDRHLQRQAAHDEAASKLKASIDSFDFGKLDTINVLVDFPKSIPMAADPRWASLPFGAYSDLEHAGCIVFTADILLRFFGYNLPMEEILSEAVNKGYRMWKFGNSKTLSIPNDNLEEVKKQFPADDPIQNANSITEVEALYGPKNGIGGSAFFIDNVINCIATKDIQVYNDTRINNIQQIFDNLQSGFPVPLRVQNTVYHQDSSRSGGHYVTLFGFENGKAIIADSSYEPFGRNEIPAAQLLNAIIANPRLVCAWNLSCID